MTRAVIDPRRLDAVAFALEGVFVGTADLRGEVWDHFYRQRFPDHPPLPGHDYVRIVADTSLTDAITDGLAGVGVPLPEGAPYGSPTAEAARGIANLLDREFADRIARGGIPVQDAAVDLARRVRGAGLRIAVYCAEPRRTAILDAIGGAETMLAAEAQPRTLDEAVRRLGADPARTAVVVGGPSDLAAARRGGFALVIGVARPGDEKLLRRAGAHVVVTDVARIGFRSGTRPLSRIPDALTSRHQSAALLRSRHPAVFLDFDGTIADIVAQPTAATLVEGVASELARLARHCPVGIISGRDLADVRARVGVPGLWYAGSHGFELVGPDGQHYENEEASDAEPDLVRITSTLCERLGTVPGVLVEGKRFAVSVHYRNVDAERVDEVISTVRAAVAEEPRLRATSGRKIVEIRPDVDWDKGRALVWALGHVGASSDVLPIYVGDDLTDEDAFDAIEDSGFGVVVRHTEDGDRRSAARFAVDGPAQVHELLQRIADLVGSDPRTAPPPEDPWTVFFEGYDPSVEKLREALCTVGNGAFATRGCAPEARAGAIHYPGTYAAGIFDRLREEMAGTAVDNESMVNLPNWLPLTFRIDGGPWFDVDTTELLEYRQHLDLRRAVFVRRLRSRDAAGRITSLIQRRFVAMHLPHVGALETTISAENWSGVWTSARRSTALSRTLWSSGTVRSGAGTSSRCRPPNWPLGRC